MDLGLLLLRAVFGLLMAAHGAQKLFGWFGGYGVAKTGGLFEHLGFRPGWLFAALAGAGEAGGGLLLALGLFGPVGPAVLIAVMLVAAVAVHLKGGIFVTTNGIEVPLLYGVVAAALAYTGYGALSLDAALGLTTVWAGVAPELAIAAGLVIGAL